MVMMPNCPSKKEIQDFLRYHIITNECTRIFSLIGPEAGMERFLPASVQVHSAECERDTFLHQQIMFPQFSLNYGLAHDVLRFSRKKFDFIWLDFFGKATNSKNIKAIDNAAKKIKKNHYLAVTSNCIDRTCTGLEDEVAYIISKGFEYKAGWKYKNGVNMMKFMFFLKN